MTDITPADLAKFVHRVPVGAIIPAETRYASLNFGCITGPMNSHADQKFLVGEYWTAEPIRTPEHQRLEDEYMEACEAVYAVEAEIRALAGKRDALACDAQRLYGQLKAAGHR